MKFVDFVGWCSVSFSDLELFSGCFFFAAESQGQGWFGKFKLDGEPDYYTDSSASFVPAVGLSKPRDIAERRKLISDKPDITGGWITEVIPQLFLILIFCHVGRSLTFWSQSRGHKVEI